MSWALCTAAPCLEANPISCLSVTGSHRQFYSYLLGQRQRGLDTGPLLSPEMQPSLQRMAFQPRWQPENKPHSARFLPWNPGRSKGRGHLKARPPMGQVTLIDPVRGPLKYRFLGPTHDAIPRGLEGCLWFCIFSQTFPEESISHQRFEKQLRPKPRSCLSKTTLQTRHQPTSHPPSPTTPGITRNVRRQQNIQIRIFNL